MHSSSDDDSDYFFEGYDPKSSEWIIAGKRKRNKKMNEKTNLSKNENDAKVKIASNLCGSCQKEMGAKDRSLECGVCLLRYHVVCQGVSDKLYEALGDDADSCAWFCRACKEGAKQLRLQIIALQREQLSIKSELDRLATTSDQNSAGIAALRADISQTNQKLEAGQKELQARVNAIEAISNANVTQNDKKIAALQAKLEKRLQEVEKSCGSASAEVRSPSYAQAAASMTALETRLEELSVTVKSNLVKKDTDTRALKRGLSELEDIENRKLNLAVFNLPETGSSEGDITAFKEMIKSEFKLSVKLQEATRLGKKKDTGSRILRVKLEALSEKKLILAKAKDLRTSHDETYASVFIRPDLTKCQLEASKNLRALLQEKRQAFPEKRWMIKRNEIVMVPSQRD